MIMFEKFGEFTSFEEINKKAAELKAAGDKDSLLKLCDENGLDHEDAEDFMDGVIEELTTLKLAAIGKITVEKADLKIKGVVNDWTDIIIQMIEEDEKLAAAVRSKEKPLYKLLGILLRHGFEIKEKLDDRIVKAAKLNPPIYLGIPSSKDVKEKVREYYLGGKG